MQDGILKGTGNSRYLKSIANFLTQYPTYEDMVAALAAGTLPIDLNGINTAGWSQVPTYLNKANLLSDSTESAIWGSTGNRTVDAALAKIGPVASAANTTATSARNTIVTGSFVGTGTTKKLTLASTPKLAFLSRYYASGNYKYYYFHIYTPDMVFRCEESDSVNAETSPGMLLVATPETIFSGKTVNFPSFTSLGTCYYTIICE